MKCIAESKWFRLLALSICAALFVYANQSHAQLATAVEFYNKTLKHYFVTASPGEINSVDTGGAGPGWVRTGGEFSVFLHAATGSKAVCRFYGTPGKGPNSHFYTADAGECEAVKKDAGWTYEGLAFYVPVPTSGNCAAGTQPVYRTYNNGHVRNDANHRFMADVTAYERMPKRGYPALEGIVFCAPMSEAEIEADIKRFLEQITLGPTEELIQQVKQKGMSAWLDEQFTMNVTKYTQYPFWDPPQDFKKCIDDTTPPITPEKFCQTNIYSPGPVGWEFFRQSKTAPDQVRLRMAHILHQLFIATGMGQKYAHAEFQQRLRDAAFGTYENALHRYTISPQLGHFQNWVNNIPEKDGIKPNENYARELMQLFSTGVDQLNEDGTLKRNAAGQLIPVYSQKDIEETARILTGFTYPLQPGRNDGYWSPWAFTGDMRPFDEWHDRGVKSLFGGTVQFPAGGTAAAEVARLVKEVVAHSNTPPFIVKQLIQKTVTSNPTPGYVLRVVRVFKDNGSGVRGDLKAVMRAILFDAEARGPRKLDLEYGRLREPALFVTTLLRSLKVTTDGEKPLSLGYESSMNLFNSPTVFSYYPADYILAANNLPAPEFGIFSTAEFVNRANQVNDMLYNNDQPYNIWWQARPWVPNAVGTPAPSMADFLPDADDFNKLVERFNRLYLHGTMSLQMKATIKKAYDKIPVDQKLRRVKLVANLVLVSVDYQIQK